MSRPIENEIGRENGKGSVIDNVKGTEEIGSAKSLNSLMSMMIIDIIMITVTFSINSLR